jgi:hypothetical protein
VRLEFPILGPDTISQELRHTPSQLYLPLKGAAFVNSMGHSSVRLESQIRSSDFLEPRSIPSPDIPVHTSWRNIGRGVHFQTDRCFKIDIDIESHKSEENHGCALKG